MSGAATDAPAGSIRLVTWNIHACIGLDRRYAPQRIAAAIKALAPDVIGLQEVDDRRPREGGMSQFEYLRHATGLHGIASPTIRGSGGDYGNAVLSRWPILGVRSHDLTVRRYEPRGAVDVDIAGPHGPLRVMNLHLGLRRGERMHQLDWVLASLGEHAAEREPLVLMGDFNEWARTAGRLAAIASRFAATFAPKTFPAALPVARLDRIYVAPQPERLAAVVPKHVDLRYCSDHLPVVVDVCWAAQEAAAVPVTT